MYLQKLLITLGRDVEHTVPELVIATCRALDDLVLAFLYGSGMLRFCGLASDGGLTGRHWGYQQRDRSC